MSDKNENFFNETAPDASDIESFNEVVPDSSDVEKFNEAASDSSDVESFNEVVPNSSDVESFNEVVPDSSDVESFNETLPKDTDDESFNTSSGPDLSDGNNPDPNPASGYPSAKYTTPVKNSTPKVMIGVVAGLAVVIIGLIIFLVVSIMNKKNQESTTADPTPTNIATEIVVDGSPDTNSSDNSSDGKSGTENNSTGSGQENTNPSGLENNTEEIPTFNVTVELGQYKGITVDYKLPEVTDEDVQGALDYFASSLEEEVDITDRPIANGDYVVIDYEGKVDGEAFDGGSDTDAEFELGSGMFIPGFEDGLAGKNIGDTVSLDLTFPEDYTSDPDLAGKAVNFTVTIKEAYTYVTPELTDELVAENSEYKTIAEYEAAAREELKKQAVEYADSQAKNDIIQKIIDGSKFDGQIDEKIAYEVQDCIDYYDYICQMQFGVNGATYFGYLWGLTEAEYLAMVNEESTMSVKYSAILDEIVKKENLTVSEEEYENMFQETFMDYYGFETKEEVYEQMTEDQARETINGYVLHDKAESIIFDSAVINNKPE